MRAPTLAAAGAVGLAAYAAYEPYLFSVRERDVPVSAGCPPLEVLHLSDTHLGGTGRPRYRMMADFLRSLPARMGQVDLVLATGDLIEGNEGIPHFLDAVHGLQARLGKFYVLGSHDYFLAEFQAYTKYFTGRRPIAPARADTDTLQAGLVGNGWQPLTNTEAAVEHEGSVVRIAGVDDPYLGRHRTDHIARSPNDACAIGLMHSPDVVSEFALAGFDLALAGHTHAGQVRLPGLGAVVTNCSLPTALAGGLHRIGRCWLHVSPGLGTGRFAPIRFGARPEVTLLRLNPEGA